MNNTLINYWLVRSLLLTYSFLQSEISNYQKTYHLTRTPRDKSALQCQPLLRERMRESTRQECVKCERGSPRPNSKRLSPKNFCWWWQNPSKQSAQNKCTGAARAKVTWGLSQQTSIWCRFWGSVEGNGIGGWGLWVWGRSTTVLVCFSIRGSGTVDVQRLAVLLWSKEHAEVHTFIHDDVGVATRTHTCYKKETWPESIARKCPNIESA